MGLLRIITQQEVPWYETPLMQKLIQRDIERDKKALARYNDTLKIQFKKDAQQLRLKKNTCTGND